MSRLSSLPYLVKTATDPRNLFEHEREQRGLSPRFKPLLERFAPRTTKSASPEHLIA